MPSKPKKKITSEQRFALKCYYEAIKNEFHADFSREIKKQIEESNYADEYKALEGYLSSKTSERVAEQIKRFFSKLLEGLLS
jgi:hypothetical protein